MAEDLTCTECGETFVSFFALCGHVGSGHVRKHRRQDFDCGTVEGYKAHKRRDEKPDADCKAAWRKYNVRRRANKKLS